MRLLLLSDLYPPLVGGVEQHVATLAHELAARGHDVTVATVGGSADDDATDGVRVVRLPSLLGRLPGAYEDQRRAFAPPAPDPELLARLARVVARSRPEVVHAHGWIARSWLPLARAVRAPLVVTAHEYGPVCARKDLRYFGVRDCTGPAVVKCTRCAADHYGPLRGAPIALAQLAFGPVERAVADRFIAVSRAVAEHNRLPPDRVEVIPNFLPDGDPETGDADRWLDELPSSPFVLFVGALGAHKGLPVLLDAWRRLPDPPPLVAIGHRWADTPEDLPPGVRLFEDWPNHAVRGAWRRSLFGVIPSVWMEPFGIVALEAMAAGRAVVASQTGGLADVVADGETGLTVEPGDAEALATAIARLLHDVALRDRLGAEAARRMTSFRASAVVPRIEAVYRDTLRRAARTPVAAP